MQKNIKTKAILIMVYLFLFWIGFKSGEIYTRTRRGLEGERLYFKPDVPTVFYIVENRNYGTYKYTEIYEVSKDSVIIKLLVNKNLRPLLKLKDLKIYSSRGKRIY